MLTCFYHCPWWMAVQSQFANKQVTNGCIFLVNIFQVNAEFLRINTKPLQPKFMSQLDHFSDKLMQIFKSKGGVKGKRIKNVLAIKDLVSRNAFLLALHSIWEVILRVSCQSCLFAACFVCGWLERWKLCCIVLKVTIQTYWLNLSWFFCFFKCSLL